MMQQDSVSTSCSVRDDLPLPTRPEDVPKQAYEVASKGLEDWKRTCAREPDALSVTGAEYLVADAQLRPPYVKYRLFSKEIDECLDSDSLDPTQFAFFQAYVFPIYSDDTYMGGLRVNRRIMPDGSWIGEGKGEFGLEGIDLRDDDLCKKIELVANAVKSTNVRLVGVVKYMNANMDSQIVLETSEGRFYLPSESVFAGSFPTVLSTEELKSRALHDGELRAEKARLRETLGE